MWALEHKSSHYFHLFKTDVFNLLSLISSYAVYAMLSKMQLILFMKRLLALQFPYLYTNSKLVFLIQKCTSFPLTKTRKVKRKLSHYFDAWELSATKSLNVFEFHQQLHLFLLKIAFLQKTVKYFSIPL